MRWPHDKAHRFSSYNCNETERLLFTTISLRRRKLDCWQNTLISALKQKLEFKGTWDGRMGKMLPVSSTGEEPACQCSRHKRCGFDPWVGKTAWRRTWQHTPVFLPGESHGQRSLAGCPRGCTETQLKRLCSLWYWASQVSQW